MNFSKPKKLCAILIAALILVLAACSSNNSGDTDNSSNEKTADKNEETFTLKYNIAYGQAEYDFEPKKLATEEFKKRVEEETNGRVKIELYYSSQLVPAGEMLDALSSGTLDMGTYNPHVFGDTLPTGHALSLPFWANDEENALQLLNSEYGQIHEQEVEDYGVKPLFQWQGGEQAIISKDPITSIDDLKGKLFRIESGLWTPWYEEIGMAPVKVDPVDIYAALQRGTVDGIIFSSYTIDTYKLNEVADYMTVPGIVNPVIQTTWISLDVWNKIPSDLQEIIMNVSDDIEKETAEASKKVNEFTIENAEKLGVEVNTLSEEELKRFKESTQIIWDDVESINGDTARMIEILRENQEK